MVWALNGGRAELPCAPDPRVAKDSPQIVLWYRASNTTPVYSYDARSGEFEDGERWTDGEALGKRAYFSVLTEPPVLVLDPAHARDEGVYKCRVDYRYSSSTYRVVNLTIVVPPGPPVILWQGVGVVGSVGPLSEGSRQQLTCRSVGGRPPPVLTWWRQGTRLPQRLEASTDVASGKGMVEVTASVTASRDLQGATLTCHAQTPLSSQTSKTTLIQPRTASVALNITLPPLDVQILGSGVAVSAGTMLRLVCRSVGSHPPAELSWWRGHSHLTSVLHAMEDAGNVTTATLTIEVDMDFDGVTLACIAVNPAMPHARLTDSVKLEVHYTPVVHLELGKPIDPSAITEGSDVYFECSIKSNPPVIRVQWYHNGALVEHDVAGGVVVSGLSLVLQRLRRKHSGTYTCAAINYEGRNTSNPVHITVRHAPVCAGVARQRTQGAARGSLAVVTCHVEAVPAHNLTWAWAWLQEDGSEERVPARNIRTDRLTSAMTVTPHSLQDYGELLCRASNDVGQQREPCVVSLVPAGTPDPPLNCSTTPTSRADGDQGRTSLAVTCLEGFDGGLPQVFLLEAWQNGVLLANVSSDFPEWVVAGLEGGKGATLRVSAQNARGRSETLRLEVHTPRAQQHAALDSESSFLGVTPLLGALVGVAGVLLLLLIVSIVIARHARRKASKPPVHTHDLVMTPTGSSWDCYDPEGGAGLQPRHRSLDILAHTHGRATPDGAHSPENNNTPIRRRQGTPAVGKRVKTSSLPHIHMNGQLSNRQQPQESDASSNSSDSDVESVVEVTDLTMLRRPVSEAGYAYSPLATKETVLPRPSDTPGHLASSSRRSRESLRLASGSPLPNKDNKCMPKLVIANPRDGDDKRNPKADRKSPSPRVSENSTPDPRPHFESNKQENPAFPSKDSKAAAKTRKSHKPGENSSVEDLPAPPKPPRVFLPPEKPQQHIILSPSKTSSKAPLAEDEVSDAYCNGRRLNHPACPRVLDTDGVQVRRPSDPGGVGSVI